jgi:hypothetical protein
MDIGSRKEQSCPLAETIRVDHVSQKYDRYDKTSAQNKSGNSD